MADSGFPPVGNASLSGVFPETWTCHSPNAGSTVWSAWKNSRLTWHSTGGTGANEARNLDGNALFVSRTPDPPGAVGGEYDDQMLWISAGTLYAKLIAAGVLP